MDEERFWQIVESCAGEAECVTAALTKLTPDEIIAWDAIYWSKHNALHRWDVWGAAYVINGGCGDDSYHYFKAFAIGKGRTFYQELARDPDSVGPMISEEDVEECCDNELLNYAAIEALEAVGGGEPPGLSNEGSEPSGTPWEEDDLPRLFPRLARQFDL